MNARQRRALEATRELLGAGTEVRRIATGRAHARMTNGVWALIGVFGAAFLFVLIVLHAVLIPGVLLVLILYGMVRPGRAVAVTDGAVLVLTLSGWNGKPNGILETLAPGSLRQGIRPANGGKVNVQLGSDLISLKRPDLEALVAAVPTVEVPPPPIPL
jgi:hypothetical protein